MDKKKKYRYLSIYEDLFQKITEGIYPLGSVLPSEKEIGKLYSVERTTVRKALELLVNDGMVKKMQGIGAKVVNDQKVETPHKKYAKSDTILFFLATTPEKKDRVTQPFYSNMFFHIENELKKMGYKTIYSTISESDNIEELLNKHNYAGIIFASYGVAIKHLDYVYENRIPFVTVNNDYKNGVCFTPDNFSGGYEIGKHLAELGHRNIGLLTGLRTDSSCFYRLAGFNTAMREYGINIEEKFIKTADWVAEQGFIKAKELLTEDPENRPSAIFAFNDDTALGAIRAINELDLKIPDDISVAGFDNIPQTEYTVPSLTTINCNADRISYAAVKILNSKIDGDSLEKLKITVPVSLIVRGSTGPGPYSKS